MINMICDQLIASSNDLASVPSLYNSGLFGTMQKFSLKTPDV